MFVANKPCSWFNYLQLGGIELWMTNFTGPWQMEIWSCVLAWRTRKPSHYSNWGSHGSWHHSCWQHSFQGESISSLAFSAWSRELRLWIKYYKIKFEVYNGRFHSLQNMQNKTLKSLQPQSQLMWGVYWAYCWKGSTPTYVLILKSSP